MASIIDDTHQKEEGASADAVIDVLDQCALDSIRIQRKNSQHHKPEVADAGIGNQFLQVYLHH